MDILENRIRVCRLLQRLPLLNALEPIVHPIENVAKRAFARELVFLIASLDECLAYFGGRQIGVLPLGLQLRVRMSVRFHNQSNIDG